MHLVHVVDMQKRAIVIQCHCHCVHLPFSGFAAAQILIARLYGLMTDYAGLSTFPPVRKLLKISQKMSFERPIRVLGQ